MATQTERIIELEETVTMLQKAGHCNTLGGIALCANVDTNRDAIALNTASIESFERTIADMQAQIDKLTTEASDE